MNKHQHQLTVAIEVLQRGCKKVRGHEVSTVEEPSSNSAELDTEPDHRSTTNKYGVGNDSPGRQGPYQGSNCSLREPAQLPSSRAKA